MLINQTLDDVLSQQEGDFDADTRWALTWFEDVGFDEGEFGKAEQLSKSKNTSVNSTTAWPEERVQMAKAFRLRRGEHKSNDIYRTPRNCF